MHGSTQGDATRTAAGSASASPPTAQGDLVSALRQGERIIHLVRTPVTFTKSHTVSITAVVAVSDRNERGIESLISSAALTRQGIIAEYLRRDPNAAIDGWPEHRPVRMLALASDSLQTVRENVFLCPCFNQLSFELVDCWAAINRQINVPMWKRTFDDTTLSALYGTFSDSDVLLAYTSLHAQLHELGHHLAPVAIDPVARNVLVDGFLLDVVGEASTDSHAGARLAKYLPTMSLYVTLVRLPGHWGRRGFTKNRERAWLNSDNDSLLSAFYWGFALQHGYLKPAPNSRWSLSVDRLAEMHDHVLNEITAAMTPTTAAEQSESVQALLERYVPHDSRGFRFDDTLKRVFERSLDLPELPELEIPDIFPEG